MATFTLDSSTLGSEQFQVVPFDLDGEFRDIQFTLGQSGSDQDAEIHYLEVHYTISGVSKESM